MVSAKEFEALSPLKLLFLMIVKVRSLLREGRTDDAKRLIDAIHNIPSQLEKRGKIDEMTLGFLKTVLAEIGELRTSKGRASA